jgi:phosphopantothenate synthetase
MENVLAEPEYVSIQVNAAVLVVQLILDIVQVTQIVLNVVIIYLVKQMMEEVENVYFQANAVVLLSVENALEEMISNAASEVVAQMEVHLQIHILVPAQVVVELA